MLFTDRTPIDHRPIDRSPARRAHPFAATVRAVLVAALAVSAAGCASPGMAGLDGTLWFQTAAEYRANAVGTYKTAGRMLEVGLADPAWTAAPEQADAPVESYRDLPPAVVVDVDETILDNSPFMARLIKEDLAFTPELWNQWVDDAMAAAIPGAAQFARDATLSGVTIFYVTNRDSALEAATRRNLSSIGFPLGSDVDTVLLKGEEPGWGSDKGSRRARVAETHRVVLLIGDNLGDFMDGYKTGQVRRQMLVDRSRAMWGTKWLMLPNPMYGSWEDAVWLPETGLSPREQMQKKMDALQPWP